MVEPGEASPTRVLVCVASSEHSERLVTLLATAPNFDLVGSPRTMDLAVELLRQRHVDIVIVDVPHMEQSLAVRRADSLVAHPNYRLVLAESAPSITRMVRASQYGFDEIIDPLASDEELLHHLRDVEAEARSVHFHPLIAPLEVIPGLFTRRLRYDDATDQDIVELLSLGLDDRDISTALGVDIQSVRNAISRLLVAHGLTARTQLAALHIRSEQPPLVT